MEHFIAQMFKEVLENPEIDESVIQNFFSKDYIQIVDGHTLDYAHFVQHLRKLKEKVIEQKVTLENIAVNQNTVFTKHRVTSKLRNNTTTIHKVLAEFTVEKEKIIQCDELTLLVKGNESERDLGSEV